MTETPWDAGPWAAVKVKGRWDIAIPSPVLPKEEANARLMAAAPELYAALKRMEAHFRILPPDMDAPGSVFAQACAALTKATGETP